MMTLEELKKLFATKRLKVEKSNMVYTFKGNTMLLDGRIIANFELYEENGNFYLKTTPYIYDNEDLLIVFKNENPVFINLSTRFRGRHFIALEEV